jgi:hypothetical protein
MKYDPIELMRLNITEDDIQKQRDFILEVLTETNTKSVVIPMAAFWLPFVIDMLADNEFSYNPNHYGCELIIKIDL